MIGNKEFWSRGYGTEALGLLLDFAFAILNLNNVLLEVHAFNTRAIRCYEKVGFKVVGRRRESRLVAGKHYDRIIMDILAREFQGGSLQGILGPDET